MIDYSPEASAHLDDLVRHDERLGRPEATRNLLAALVQAEADIGANPSCGAPFPRPYPDLVMAGCAWIKRGAYWIAFTPDPPVMIVGVFHDSADIPARASYLD